MSRTIRIVDDDVVMLGIEGDGAEFEIGRAPVTAFDCAGYAAP